MKITGVCPDLLEASEQRVGATSRPVGLAPLTTADEKER